MMDDCDIEGTIEYLTDYIEKVTPHMAPLERTILMLYFEVKRLRAELQVTSKELELLSNHVYEYDP